LYYLKLKLFASFAEACGSSLRNDYSTILKIVLGFVFL
jgi:hypothetical protein